MGEPLGKPIFPLSARRSLIKASSLTCPRDINKQQFSKVIAKTFISMPYKSPNVQKCIFGELRKTHCFLDSPKIRIPEFGSEQLNLRTV